MINWDKLNADDQSVIDDIVKRTKALLGPMIDTMKLSMDISAAHINHPLKLRELFAADDENFIHDVCGISYNIKRSDGSMRNYFLPRYSS
jgi:hypothetical protein